MEFEILGPLRARSRDGACEVSARAQHGLLAVLLTSPNRPIPDDRLIDELWGDAPPESARHLLQVYASQLRGLLGELPDGPRVVRDGNGYALRLEAGELDAERFEAAVARARELQELDPEAAERVLSEAMELWRGTPFAGVRQSSPAVEAHTAFLERLHLAALHTWFDISLGLGRHRELVPQLAELAAQHPYDEALHAQLTLALYRCGRQAEALATARTLESRLRDALGIEASSEVRELYRRILLHDPGLSLEPPEPPSNLPHRLTSFVGRDRELHEVAELVESSRLVTLTGPGGIGKTRLALEAAGRLRPRFSGGLVDRPRTGHRPRDDRRRAGARPRRERCAGSRRCRRPRPRAQSAPSAPAARQLRARRRIGRSAGGDAARCNDRSSCAVNKSNAAPHPG